MQLSEMDVESTIRRLLSAELPPDMEARLVCSCRSRLYRTSCAQRRHAVCLAAGCSLVTVALGWAALSAHHKHVRLRATS